MGFSFRRYLLSVLSCRECAVTQSEWKRLRFSYAQNGEDIIAEALLPEARGFYVEVGAFHPVSISNTYLFYRKGWRGIVIDPAPHVARLFQRRRPEDTMLTCAVGEQEAVCRFDIMPAGETNRLSATRKVDTSSAQPLYSIQVPCRRLASLLDEYLGTGRAIDFLSVDAEGHDLSVLRSNDWQKYRPRVLAVEDFQPPAQSSICSFLSQQGYKAVITSKITRFFVPTGLDQTLCPQ
jgi:FkbM family methyltransferase